MRMPMGEGRFRPAIGRSRTKGVRELQQPREGPRSGRLAHILQSLRHARCLL